MYHPFRHLLALALVTLATTSFTTHSSAAGYSVAQVEDLGHDSLTVGIWYPTDTAAASEPNTRFGQALAIDAAPSGTALPIVLISHGFGGWHGGHANLALALAEAGFVVAAPSHAGNTFTDMSAPIERWALDRPRQISATLDYLANHWQVHQLVDLERVGVFGFSAGGFTVLSLLGGVPDFGRAQQHCATTPEEFACREGMVARMMDKGLDQLPSAAWGADSRIRAAAIAAPGFAFAYAAENLKSVTTPLQLWSAVNDQSVPHEANAVALAAALTTLRPTATETHWVENAGHFSFMIIPCRAAFKLEAPEEYEMICGDAAGFDRRKFHQSMNAEMIRFFSDALALK